MSEAKKWYVVHTYSGYESNVASNIEKAVESRHLSDMISEVKVPIEMVTEIKDGKKKEVERKIYPSYVMVKMVMNDDTWYIVRNIRGVTGFVGPGSKPVPLTAKEVKALGVEDKSIMVDYEVGDTIKITSGSLEGFSGIVKKIDLGENKVSAEISILGRLTDVELELNQIKVVNSI